MDREDVRQFLRFKSFGEVSMDLFVSRIVKDLEEYIFNDRKTSIDKHSKELINDWMAWLKDDDEWDIIKENEKEFLTGSIEDSIGAMPIWKSNKELQTKVMNSFKFYFGADSALYPIFKNAYIKGLGEEGLIS
ncbi:hypothetical protein RCG23_09220 [Neobacillus sp. PS3-34]|uniref:hypothetical protein n=1 Tax=Neobacillus sp. PS3-34 TaxID=3070678 RepID=UPI0027E08047|nr:hypothetical protein [Neobacillus sp. PS3-34]WML50005.1 hypothetical protein RCG23_09220 [Neobacillus sp. PS3-34]